MKRIVLEQAARYGVAGHIFLKGVSQTVDDGLAGYLLTVTRGDGRGGSVSMFREVAEAEGTGDAGSAEEKAPAPPSATGSGRRAKREHSVEEGAL